ncbi:MAG TPA: OsmC family protein [Anaerolineae bacterium]|nr:OsmC family protein [Anaerolineae bacterium]HQI87535.1 OsmC family protein [Anaerolineae bacterium]
MITRTASAVWEGNLVKGNGTMKLGSGAFEGVYSFTSRFENGMGTNPEELIGAAHAGCFSMALSHMLAEAGFTPTRVATKAAVKMDKVEGGFKIVRIELTTEAEVPGIDEATFLAHANAAKTGCPVSQALASVEITLQAHLV